MGFDLSAVDAELEQLGRPLSAGASKGAPGPENPVLLARNFAGISGTENQSLANVDDELSALAQISGVSEPLYVTRPQRTPVFTQREPSLVPAPEVAVAPARKRSSIPLPPTPEVSAPHHSQPPAALSEHPVANTELAPLAQLDQHTAADSHAELPASTWPTAMSGEPSFALPPESVRPASIAPSTGRESTPLTQSQEIVLPDPIPREELSTESGELRLDSPLDSQRPGSGSYSLPEAQPHHEEAQNFGRSGSHEFSEMVDDDVQDALEGSQPLSIGAPAALTRATRNMDRDPDAEFDALLSEATDPRGIPVVNSDLDTDDLLRGLELDELEIDDTPVTQESEADQVTHEADELARSLYEEPEADNTEILDRASALAIEALAPRKANAATASEGDTFREEFALDAELDSGELEIMLDDEPPAAPATSKAPPPPPPGSADKRPSILGRLFGGKRDGE